MLRLTPFEIFLKYTTGIISLPIAPFFLFSVKANTNTILLRYGKLDRIIKPGLRWSPPGYIYYNIFLGARTYTFKNLRLLDSSGTPIIVSAILQYRVNNAALMVINANGNTDVLERAANVILRQVCSSLPYMASNNTDKDLRKNVNSISNEVCELLSKSVDNFGFSIDTINIIEVNYAPEIAQQMLMKQQSLAYMEARKEIVNAALNVVKDVVINLPELSKNTQENIVSNLLTTLTSNNIQQVLPLK